MQNKKVIIDQGNRIKIFFVYAQGFLLTISRPVSNCSLKRYP
jgi:hypothetical protein